MRVCPICGTKVNNEAMFCSKCGFKLNEVIQNINQNQKRDDKFGFALTSMICGIIGLVLICIYTGIVPCIISFILGIIALSNKESKPMAIAGISCSSIGIIIFLFMIASNLVHSEKDQFSKNKETIVNGTKYEESSSIDEEKTEWANEFTSINDFRYIIQDDSITLIRYEGDDTQILLSPVYTIDGYDYKLISMGDDACFLSETYITSVIIPEGVEEIGASCFNSCSSLERIYLPSTINEIPDGFFNYFNNYEVYCDSTISMPSERDYRYYDRKEDDMTMSGELGESMARGINGMLSGFNSTREDRNRSVEIYYGGSKEQWEELLRN